MRLYRRNVVPERFAASRSRLGEPDDAGMLDVVGFDTAVPQLTSPFATDDNPNAIHLSTRITDSLG